MSKEKGSFIRKAAAFIVDRRSLFFLLYGFAVIFSFFSMKWVRVEGDITTYLQENTETRQGLLVMDREFKNFATAKVMVSNITFDTAETLFDDLSGIEGVEMVAFDGTRAHFRDASALYDINFKGVDTDPVVTEAMKQVRSCLRGYDAAVDSMIGYDFRAEMNHEMTVILIVAVIIIVVVLTLTSRSYAEVAVLLLTFGTAALLNKGTDFFFPKISFISDSIAVVLQLALAIDYAVILCHRFSDERETGEAREACIDALAKSIPEISASSLTTISGLFALSFMKFRIGLDLSMVLIKAVLLSMFSVFTLMPGLLMVFNPWIEKTKHRRLLPQVSFLGRFAVASRYVMPVLFAVVLVGAAYLSNRCPYTFSFNDIATAKMSPQQVAHFRIRDRFSVDNMLAILVPSGDYEAEKALLRDLESRKEVKQTVALSSMEVFDHCVLTDSLTPREFSEHLDLDYEVAQALYGAYAVNGQQYGEILRGLDRYEVPLFDMFRFIKKEVETNHILLDGDESDLMNRLFAQLGSAEQQLQSDSHSRMVVFLNLPVESEETFDFLEEMHRMIGRYYSGDFYIIGSSTSARDLAASFLNDNLLIAILSALFVILVLLFTFRSVGLPLLLIVVIQGSIWINFSFPVILHQPLFFLGYLIVNAIQMGANIDYAIVISSHYQELKKTVPHREAILRALNTSFPTVFTSGTIMAAAGLLIGGLSANPVVAIMGTCLGRGTIISILLVLFTLPAILVLGDSLVERTQFRLKTPEFRIQKAVGTMWVRGHVRGYLKGTVDADFDGLIRGELNAQVLSGFLERKEEKGGSENDV